MGKAQSNAFVTVPYIFHPREYELELTDIAASSLARTTALCPIVWADTCTNPPRASNFYHRVKFSR
jgi:hypothetical protein